MLTETHRAQVVRLIPAPVRSFYRSCRKTIGTMLLPRVVKAVRRSGTNPETDPEKVFRLATRGFLGMICPFQNKSEFLPLLRLVHEAKPRVVMEVGTAQGGTLFTFAHLAAADARIISIDLPGGVGGGGYSEDRIPLYQAFALPQQQLELVRDDSHDPRVLRRVKDWLADDQVDFLFIDGDHSYAGVKQDYEFYAPLVRPGGIIAFHDIGWVSDTKKFWDEVNVGKQNEEFIGKEGRIFGIGVLHV